MKNNKRKEIELLSKHRCLMYTACEDRGITFLMTGLPCKYGIECVRGDIYSVRKGGDLHAKEKAVGRKIVGSERTARQFRAGR